MSNPSILVADDESINVELLTEWLHDAGYDVVAAADGVEALEILRAQADRFDAVLLDRMMPKMTGTEVLAQMRADPVLSVMPTIFQSARAAKEDVLEGLRAGALYYLCKPFDKDTLLAVVATAVEDHQRYRAVREETTRTTRALALLEHGTFQFRSMLEARDIAALIAGGLPDSELIAVGLLELFLNSIEHGNLGISYEEKTRLNEENRWQAEIARRLALPEHRDKFVTVELTRDHHRLSLRIQDQGRGFDWRRYLDPCAERAFDNHGRGIVLASSLGFETFTYLGCGNTVAVSVLLPAPVPTPAATTFAAV